MRAVLLDAPESMLEDRRRLGHDRWDEVWEGVLHMLPPPSEWHQRFGTRLLVILAPLGEQRGFEASYETGLFHPTGGERDYRVPDIVFATAAQRSARGVEGRAELIIELLSPNDESRDKLPFYAELGTPEVWLVDPQTRAVEMYVLRGSSYHAALPDASGTLRSPALAVDLQVVEGPRLRIRWDGGAVEI